MGFFGILGSGNIGNDGSLAAVLRYLRQHHLEAELDAMCTGPDNVARQFALPATALHRSRHDASIRPRSSGPLAKALRVAIDAIVDSVRLSAWVRRHDAVIVPGMGVLEATLPLRPWQTPLSLVVLTASGRLFGTTVMLVSVGANVMNQRWTRWLTGTAGRMAAYRSYRDEASRIGASQLGIDVTHDPVYPDLAFNLATPARSGTRSGTVGVGVMNYRGGNDDRSQSDVLHADYVAKMSTFVRWLVDHGYHVHLFTGDPTDETAVRAVLANVRGDRPDRVDSRVIAVDTDSLDELMIKMAAVDLVVATRFHNVLCALKVATPTVSIGYGAKNEVLMRQMGMHDFCQDVRHLDVDRLIRQFLDLERRSDEIIPVLREGSLESTRRVQEQLLEVSRLLTQARRGTALPARSHIRAADAQRTPVVPAAD